MEKVVMNMYRDLYCGKTVFVTGHTGFKGSWMCRLLTMLGARVVGYALEPPTDPSLFDIAGIGGDIISVTGDIRDAERLKKAVLQYKPEIIIHMAAQPIVLEGYKKPAATYEINVMGTVNICEAVRLCESVRSFVNVTTDKVYKNNEWLWGYRENDALDGFDPYSNSKSCSELVTASYIRSFFDKRELAVSTCRAGNVIGGGDFAPNRIIPDCVRAMQRNEKIIIRNPRSTRPYQFVLEPVAAYLELAARQYDDRSLAGSYNIGPDECGCIETGKLAELFCKAWGDGAEWENIGEIDAPHEANFLRLDNSKIKSVLGWRPRLNITDAVEKTVEWSKAYLGGGDVRGVMDRQIEEYMEEQTDA